MYVHGPPNVTETRRLVEYYMRTLVLDQQTLEELRDLSMEQKLLTLRTMSKMGMFDHKEITLH